MSNRITAFTRAIPDVTIEPWVSSALPIWRLVIIDPGSRTHEAEEDVLGRFDDDPRVPSPNYKVPRLRQLDSLEPFDASVKVRRRRIGIREPSALVDGMDKMRAVVFRISSDSGIQRSSNQRQPVILIQRAVAVV